MAKDWYVNEAELDDYQVKIIQRRSDNPLIVKGSAGSGKTILALWKAKEIQESNLGSFYLIVFTKTLRKFIEDGIKNIGLDNDRVLYHWDWKNRKGMPEADYIIVDEVQDFTESQIIELKNKARNSFLFYGDSAQQLYKSLRNENTLTLEEMSGIVNAPLENLVYNHRLPKKIARFAQYISSDNDDLEIRCKYEGETKPRIYEYNSFEEQLNKIVEIIKEDDLTDVGIFFTHNSSVKTGFDKLKAKGLNVEAKFDENRRSFMTLDFTTDNPKLMTYHSAKGLQFETVFLPNCNIEEKRWQNPLYVAITRTYKDLYVMHSGDLSSFFDTVPNDLYNKNDAADHELPFGTKTSGDFLEIEDDDLPF